MTTIIGIQGDGFAILASDSMTVYDNKPYMAENMAKVVERGDYAFAVAGDALAGHIANHFWKPPRVNRTMDADDFVMQRVMPSLRTSFIVNGYEPKPDDKDSGWEMLLAIDGRIWQIDSGFGWTRDDRNLYAIGIGGPIGLGVIASLSAAEADEELAVAIAHRAIQISTEYNIYTGGETQLVVQKDKHGK